jgi:hypothetical protein
MNGRNQRGLKFTLENEAQRVFGFCRSGWLPLSGACDFTVPSTNRFFLREKTKGNVPLLFLIISLSLSVSLCAGLWISASSFFFFSFEMERILILILFHFFYLSLSLSLSLSGGCDDACDPFGRVWNLGYCWKGPVSLAWRPGWPFCD